MHVVQILFTLVCTYTVPCLSSIFTIDIESHKELKKDPGLWLERRLTTKSILNRLSVARLFSLKRVNCYLKMKHQTNNWKVVEERWCIWLEARKNTGQSCSGVSHWGHILPYVPTRLSAWGHTASYLELSPHTFHTFHLETAMCLIIIM